MTNRFNMTLIAAALSLATFGCADEIDNAIDCDYICDRYASCFDDNYDSTACQNRCEDNANTDDNFQEKVDACDECIDDDSCVSSAFSCSDECSSIVP